VRNDLRLTQIHIADSPPVFPCRMLDEYVLHVIRSVGIPNTTPFALLPEVYARGVVMSRT
jgi:hypothetical protein